MKLLHSDVKKENAIIDNLVERTNGINPLLITLIKDLEEKRVEISNINTGLSDIIKRLITQFDQFNTEHGRLIRISSILQSIPLRIIILYNHCHRQLVLLSSYLTFHAHQVISIKAYDTICDYSSVISFLFDQHKFINLESCILSSINLSTKLENVIKQIKSLKRLVSFSIRQPNHKNLNENDKYDLTQILLMHKSSCLRSISLQYPYDYLDISNYTSIASNLISLNLVISGSPSTVSVYSILSILRLCHTVRYLGVIIQHKDLFQSNINVTIQAPLIHENDLPILPQMKSFKLIIHGVCDCRSIAYILRCMPNLIHLYFTLGTRSAAWSFPVELVDGYVWQQMLELYLPCLSKFEFHMSITKRYPKLDLDNVVNSFEYFVRKFSNWHMIIDRSQRRKREEFIMLRTLNYQQHKSNAYVTIPFIHCGTFETRSTTTANDHHLFYSNIRTLRIFVIRNRPTITWSSPLFQQIDYLIVQLPLRRSSLWNNLLNIVNFRQTNDTDDAQQSVTCLSHFLQLSNVTEIEFRSNFDISRWKYVQLILQACPKIIYLIINTPLLLLSKLIDNPSLIPIFKQIELIESITEKFYFPSSFAFKLLQRFPSLIRIELQVFSFDNCVSIIDIFLTHLENLSYLKIHYNQDTLLDDPFSCDYIIEKRREAFPIHIFDEQMVRVKNNGEAIEICLS